MGAPYPVCYDFALPIEGFAVRPQRYWEVENGERINDSCITCSLAMTRQDLIASKARTFRH